MAAVPGGEDIYIVSGDKDFRSQLFDGVNEYLAREWEKKPLSSLYFYSKISDFFKAKFPAIKIASELERDLLIQRLANSGSFFSTHAYIARLAAQPEFSTAQVEQLVEIPGANNQVGWIVGDADVHDFYKNLQNKYGDKINPASAERLAEIVKAGEPPSESADEIPDWLK